MTNLVEVSAGSPLKERVAEEVRSLMGRHRVTQAQLGQVLHMSQVSVSERLRAKTPFTLTDIEVLAHYFGVAPADLLGGASLTRPSGPGGGGRYAMRDLNPQPADSKYFRPDLRGAA